jgi:lipoate-protein ligase A
MALDEALARRLPSGSAVLRLYRWSRPTVSFGRNEPVRAVALEGVRRGPAASGKLDVVRRPTGGRAVLHDDELTYAVVAPVRTFGGVREAYRRINVALAEALRALGAEVRVVASGNESGAGGRVRPLDAGPCFQAPSTGEVVAGTRKLIGSAQARVGHALLQHGSIILSGDQTRLAEVVPGADAFPQPATLSELVGPVDPDDVVEAVARSLTRCFGGTGTESAYTPEEVDAARELAESKYGRAEWTWRR